MGNQWFRLVFSGLAKAALFLYIATFAAGCAHTEAGKGSGDDADGLFQQAEEAYKDERFLIAIERYRDLKNRYPYSARAIDAELRIADSYFEQESFLEAESSYEIFKELHPTHKPDYVQYRIALSYFNQIPTNGARDLSAAYRAIDSFQSFLDKYPTSEFAKQAQDYIVESRRKLADHEFYVAEFYFNRQHFLSASYRYSALLQEYPNLGYDEDALYRLGKSYFNTKMFANAKDAVSRLLSKYPESQYKGDAQAMLEKLSTAKD